MTYRLIGKREILFVGFLILALGVCAEGHPARQVKREEMHIFRDRIVLFLRYEISEPRFNSDLRERFDGDADGKLSSDERKSLAQYAQVLAMEDLRLRWDDQELSPAVILKATSGLDRELPSSYPMILYWQLEFPLPDGARFETSPDDPDALGVGGAVRQRKDLLYRLVHQLFFEDKEDRWNSHLSCRIRLAPRIEEETSDAAAAAPNPKSFEFPNGQGSFKMRLRFRP